MYNNHKIEYTLNRKRVKNINLRIKPDCTVQVSAPYFVTEAEIESFVLKNGGKIIAALIKFSNEKKNEMQYVNGERVFLFGKEFALNVVEGYKNEYRLENSRLILFVKNCSDFENRKYVFDMFRMDFAKKVFPDIVKEVYPVFNKFCAEMPELRIRNMKTQWGNCRPNKNIITLNVRLVAYDFNVIKFVVFHEFCHFIHPNHSKAFYDELDKAMPDWKIYDSILKNK